MKYFFNKIKNSYSTQIGASLYSPQEGDTIISAFPRSGSTWLRTLICNVKYPETKSNPDIFNILIPGISASNYFVLKNLPSNRVLFTHGAYDNKFKKCIYLVRDGRDSLVSFYHYMSDRNGMNIDLKTFLQLYWQGFFGQRWDESVRSWIGQAKKNLGDDLLVLHFHELKRDTEGQLIKVLDFLDLYYTSDLVNRSVELSSIDNMKQVEKQRQGKKLKEEKSFYSGGNKKDWNKYVDNSELKKFNQRSSEALTLAGYI